MPFTIRDLTTYAEMVSLRGVQREIWGLVEPDIGLYPPLLVSAAKNGGMVLGAFDDATGQMVGFLFGFLGRAPGGPFKLCSQTMGVLKEWRSQGIAEALKQEQRRRVIAQGLPLITWTFDPLEGPNAHLNLHKLRAVSRTYWRDVYGSDFGALNAGLPTDRLVVEWWVQGARVAKEPLPNPTAPSIFLLPDIYPNVGADLASAHAGDRKGSPLHLPNPAGQSIFVVEGMGVERRVAHISLDLASTPLLLEIPADIHSVKESDMTLALDWRLKVREAFEVYFAQGYLATDFISQLGQGERRNCYVLEKATAGLLAEIGIDR